METPGPAPKKMKKITATPKVEQVKMKKPRRKSQGTPKNEAHQPKVGDLFTEYVGSDRYGHIVTSIELCKNGTVKSFIAHVYERNKTEKIGLESGTYTYSPKYGWGSPTGGEYKYRACTVISWGDAITRLDLHF
jgi:hypothetical protein